MKLENIYFLCKKYYNRIATVDLVYSNYQYMIRVGDKLEETTEKLNKIECLQKDIECFLESIKKLLEYHESQKSNALYEKFCDAKKILLTKISTIVDMYESIAGNKEKIPGIDIKIPDTNNFTDFKKIIDEIDFIITKCPFFQHETESLQFAGIDVGTQWLSFVISGMAIVTSGSILLNNIAAFIDKCIIIRSHYLTTESQKQEMERSKANQNEKDELIKTINKIYKIQVDNAIKELEEITGHTISDGDERGRVEQALQKTGDLIDKGLQIVASIDVKQETKVLFEPLETHYLSIENKLKVIEDKKGKENKKEKDEN